LIRSRRRSAPSEDARAGERLERAVAVLRRYQRAGADVVPVADVLEMLGAGTETTVPEASSRDPRADPLTGAMWAGAPGTAPPEPR
jgi:hypothetical protein